MVPKGSSLGMALLEAKAIEKTAPVGWLGFGLVLAVGELCLYQFKRGPMGSCRQHMFKIVQVYLTN